MKYFLKVMKALSDSSRVKILKMLEQGERCVCEIQSVLGLAQPTISKHLKVLEDAGLVKSSKKGMWVIYRLASSSGFGGEGDVYVGVMLNYLREWLNDDPEIIKVLADLKKISLSCKKEQKDETT